MIPSFMTTLGLCGGLAARRFALVGGSRPAAVAFTVPARIATLDDQAAHEAAIVAAHASPRADAASGQA